MFDIEVILLASIKYWTSRETPFNNEQETYG